MSAHAARISRRFDGNSLAVAAARFTADSWLAVAFAVALAAIGFGAGQGIESTDGIGLSANIAVQMSLTLAGGALLAAACTVAPSVRGRSWGLVPAASFFALGALTAVSIVWSVDPANSWLEASRTLAYAASFTGAIALVRLAAGRWRSVLAGVLLATVALSVYALAAKVFPASLDSLDSYARLSVPLGEFNAVGLTAALGVVPCVWLGARRDGHGVVNALSAPVLCVLLITLMLSYSRGALAAAVIGLAFWFAFVPLRLRGLMTLAISAVAAAPVVVFAYRTPALTDNRVALAARDVWGHRLGVALLAAVVLSFAAALVLRFVAERHPLGPARRRQLGIAALVALALVPVAGIGALAHSSRGLGGSISHAWDTLTNPNAAQSSTNAGRLTALNNNHSLYWKYAINVFDSSPVVGAGAGAFPVADQRFMTGPDLTQEAHSYIFQTLADLGIIGLLVSLAAALAWCVAAVRGTGLARPRAPGGDRAERIGLVTMVAVVLVFAVDSTIDRSWFVPVDAVVALLCAGWVAGRGPHAERIARLRPSLLRLRRTPLLAAAAVAAVAVALATAWAQWQPLRSEQAANAGAVALSSAEIALNTKGQHAQANRLLSLARADEQTAVARNPLDIIPLAFLGDVYSAQGNDAAAARTFAREVTLQPSNAQTWDDLGLYYLNAGKRAMAQSAFATELYLNPQDPSVKDEYIASLSS